MTKASQTYCEIMINIPNYETEVMNTFVPANNFT